MKAFAVFNPIMKWLNKQDPAPLVPADSLRTKSLWQDTGQVYYLLNTLKLSYTTEHGVLSYENLDPESLKRLLQDIKNAESPLFKQKVVNEQADAFVISLCGVIWEESENNTRIKAITEAAMLRSQQTDFKKSQAVFKHEYFLEHNDVLNAPSLHNNNGVFTYANVSIEQFVQQLAHANNEISDDLRRRISVKGENFKSLFSQNEEKEIDRLISRQ